eukprot:2071955-Alexandrium_andersonii.AAC.1
MVFAVRVGRAQPASERLRPLCQGPFLAKAAHAGVRRLVFVLAFARSPAARPPCKAAGRAHSLSLAPLFYFLPDRESHFVCWRLGAAAPPLPCQLLAASRPRAAHPARTGKESASGFHMRRL